jgi:hypothetical protein
MSTSAASWVTMKITSPNTFTTSRATYVITCASKPVVSVTIADPDQTKNAGCTPPGQQGSWTATATITVPNGPATYSYSWTLTGATGSKNGTVAFSGTGPQTKTVTFTWTANTTSSGTVALKVTGPVIAQSNSAAWSLVCNP